MSLSPFELIDVNIFINLKCEVLGGQRADYIGICVVVFTVIIGLCVL